MYSATPLLRSFGLHVLPGIICLILASLLFLVWEWQRVTGASRTDVARWLPATALGLGAVSFLLMALRFIGVA